MEGRGALACLVVALLCLSGCAASTPSAGASCPPLLFYDGSTYLPGHPPDSDEAVGAQLEGARLAICVDGGQTEGSDFTVAAWLPAGATSDDRVLVATICSTAVPGTPDALGCEPDAPRYSVWTRVGS